MKSSNLLNIGCHGPGVLMHEVRVDQKQTRVARNVLQPRHVLAEVLPRHFLAASHVMSIDQLENDVVEGVAKPLNEVHARGIARSGTWHVGRIIGASGAPAQPGGQGRGAQQHQRHTEFVHKTQEAIRVEHLRDDEIVAVVGG